MTPGALAGPDAPILRRLLVSTRLLLVDGGWTVR
jgi:hypothetical protein